MKCLNAETNFMRIIEHYIALKSAKECIRGFLGRSSQVKRQHLINNSIWLLRKILRAGY